MGPSAAPRRALRQARAWEEKLRQPSVSTSDVYAFRDWLDDEANAAVWERLAADRYRHERFAVRRDADGFSVVDLDAAPAVEAGGIPMAGLSGLDAQAAARRLNRAELDRCPRDGRRRS